jgi:hypothetical protein
VVATLLSRLDIVENGGSAATGLRNISGSPINQVGWRGEQDGVNARAERRFTTGPTFDPVVSPHAYAQPVTLTPARQDSLRRLPRDGSQPRQPRRSPPQLPPVRTRPPLWPRRHLHDLPTRRLTNEAVITRPARLTHNRERFAADSARPEPRRLTHATFLLRHAPILPFVAWVIPSLGERFCVTGASTGPPREKET